MSSPYSGCGQEELAALRELLLEAVDRVGKPVVIGIDPSLPAGAIARALVARCGPRKAKIVRTKINRLEEGETGRRSRGGG